MRTLEDESQQAPLEGKRPWEPPRVTLAGTISLIVRMGSAQGKIQDMNDGDSTNMFLPRPKG